MDRGENIELVREGGVAWIWLARPEAGNGMTVDLLAELGEAVRRCEADRGVRAVVIAGRGRFFCVGGALDGMGADDRGLAIRQMTFHLHGVIAALARMRAPSVAAVQGAAAGAGLSLAIGCDFVVAADTAKFSSSYAAIGLSADGGQSWLLPRRIGERHARQMLLLNRRLSAAEALDLGLVDEVVGEDALEATAGGLAEGLALGPTAAFGRMKALLADGRRTGLETQLELEARAMAESLATADAAEGIAAFLDKRPPSFSGE